MGKPRPREQRHANARTINAVIARLNDTLAKVCLLHPQYQMLTAWQGVDCSSFTRFSDFPISSLTLEGL